MENTAYKMRYNIPLAREIIPIYKNPCKKCIVRACCTMPCRDKSIFESTSYWRKAKLQQILRTLITIGITVFVIAVIWGFR